MPDIASKLANNTVVVIGGSSGIGLGVATAAHARGARVVIVGRDRDRLDRAVATIGAPAATDAGRGPAVTAVVADATHEPDVVRMFETIAAAGAIDHVVVTAADLRYAPIAEMTVETARAVIDSKLLAAVLIAKHAARRLAAGGSLTFVTGVAADRPASRGSLVAAVNGALAAFVRACALELAPIRANALSPGWVDTPVWDRIAGAIANTSKDALFAPMAQRYPVRRVGTPDDLGHAAVFLMENEFVTGETLVVDGGHRLI